MNTDSLRDFVTSLNAEEFTNLSLAVNKHRFRQILGIATYKELADTYRPHPACPNCGFPDTTFNGHTDQGLKKFHCSQCGACITS